VKILRVIVDEMPKGCEDCEHWYQLGGYKACSLTLEYIGNVKPDERHRLCPLELADTLEVQSARTANEVM
jgi:hypothetical protein